MILLTSKTLFTEVTSAHTALFGLFCEFDYAANSQILAITALGNYKAGAILLGSWFILRLQIWKPFP